MFFRSSRSTEAHGTSLRTAGLSVLCLLTLAACQTSELASGSRSPLLAAEKPRDAQQCIEAIAAQPEFENIASKLYLGKEPYPQSYLSDTSRPDRTEIELLNTVRINLLECRKIALDEVIQPDARKALLASYADDDKVWTAATAGRLTWGKFNEKLKAAAARRGSQLANALAAPAPADPSYPASGSKTSKKIDLDYQPQPDLTLPQWARQERGPTGVTVSGGPNKSVYCDQFRYTKYCQ